MRFSRRTVVAGSAAVVLVAAGAATAIAYWTSTGSGSGTATVGTNSPFTVTVGAPVGGALTPGGAVDTVSFTVKNTNSGTQRVLAANATVANPDGTAWTAVTGCSASDFAITAVSVTTGDLAPSATTTGSFSIQMTNKATDQSACKLATVPLYVTVS